MILSGAFSTTEYAAHHLISQSQPSQAMPFAAFAAPVIAASLWQVQFSAASVLPQKQVVLY